MAVTFEVGKLRHTIDRDDTLGSLAAEVEIDHQVGAAGEKCHLGGAGKVIEYIVKISRDMDSHERIMAFRLAPGRLA